MKVLFYYIIFLLSLIACTNSNTSIKTPILNDNIFRYAKNIYSKPGSNKVTVYFTWKGSRDSITYDLVKKSNVLNCKRAINEIEVPVTNVAALSTTDIAMIDILGATSTITGVTDPFRISNEQILLGVKNHKIKDLGTSMDVNQELVIGLNPDVVITTAFSKTDFQKNSIIQSVFIPIIYTMSWQEETPLARAEWLKFIGMIYNKNQEADSIFSVIEKNYIDLVSKTKNVSNRPIVIAGDCYKDIWYMPGGKSYIAQYIEDAGGDFIWKNNEETGSVPINFEQIIQKSENAYVWIGSDADTYSSLLQTNKMYALLSVFKNKNIYNRNKRKNAFGGNDYWETGYIRPDYVLADFISIIHPDLLPSYNLKYYQKLK